MRDLVLVTPSKLRSIESPRRVRLLDHNVIVILDSLPSTKEDGEEENNKKKGKKRRRKNKKNK